MIFMLEQASSAELDNQRGHGAVLGWATHKMEFSLFSLSFWLSNEMTIAGGRERNCGRELLHRIEGDHVGVLSLCLHA